MHFNRSLRIRSRNSWVVEKKDIESVYDENNF